MRDISRDSAAEVCPFALFSKYRPNETKNISMVEVSKKILGLVCGGTNSATIIAIHENRKALEVENVTRTSIVAVPCFNALNAGLKKSLPMPN